MNIAKIGKWIFHLFQNIAHLSCIHGTSEGTRGLHIRSWEKSKQLFNRREFSDLQEKLSCTITPGSMSLLNCEIYKRGRVSTVADTKLLLLITHLIRPPGSIPGVGAIK